jgi:3-phytase
MKRLLVPVTATLLASACVTPPDVPVVFERYVTERDRAMNIDSVATYAPGNPQEARLFATAKEGNVVRIYNAGSGEHLRDLGESGTGDGQFQRPNGVLADAGLLIVVERDNRRVQVFNLPALEYLATFGSAELIKPYGAFLQNTGSTYRLFVTDAYETEDETVPPPEALDRRVHVFELTVERDRMDRAIGVTSSHERTIGATNGRGVLFVVESIWGDAVFDRLLIAEEDPAGGRVIKIYSFDGRFTGEVLGEGIFRTQPEGIALFQCSDRSGYWITTDQDRGRNVFHLFDRETLTHIGGFSGDVTRNTDGIWLMQETLPEFPNGALFAVHDDRAVAAFDWRDIEQALSLPVNCGTSQR